MFVADKHMGMYSGNEPADKCMCRAGCWTSMWFLCMMGNGCAVHLQLFATPCHIRSAHCVLLVPYRSTAAGAVPYVEPCMASDGTRPSSAESSLHCYPDRAQSVCLYLLTRAPCPHTGRKSNRLPPIDCLQSTASMKAARGRIRFQICTMLTYSCFKTSSDCLHKG